LEFLRNARFHPYPLKARSELFIELNVPRAGTLSGLAASRKVTCSDPSPLAKFKIWEGSRILAPKQLLVLGDFEP
jgi:hypothetical protein